jgi:hypothetical protein
MKAMSQADGIVLYRVDLAGGFKDVHICQDSPNNTICICVLYYL